MFVFFYLKKTVKKLVNIVMLCYYLSMKKCVLYERNCINCGECDVCDLDPSKKCDNCGKCIETSENYKIIKVTKIITEEK